MRQSKKVEPLAGEWAAERSSAIRQDRVLRYIEESCESRAAYGKCPVVTSGFTGVIERLPPGGVVECPGDIAGRCVEHCCVSVTIQKYLTVIDGRRQGWGAELNEQIAGGSNVFVILPNAPDFLEEFAKVLEVKPTDLPPPANQHRFFALSPFIEPKDFDTMMEAQDEGNLLFFIEQIDLTVVQPPRVKPFLVYCPIRGIISQHDNQRDARDACADYVTVMSTVRTPAAAAVYKWRNDEWYNTETC